MKALILVGIQCDFLPGGSLSVKNGDTIIPLLNKLQQYFNTVVATQDWHSKNHSGFAVNHPEKNEFDEIYLHGAPQTLWPVHCVQNSHGAELSRSLNQTHIEAIIRTGMDPNIDSYSGFYDNDHKRTTGLSGYLKDKDIQEVYVSGLAGDYCVYYTALDALREGFKACIIEDATRYLSRESFDEAMSVFTSAGGRTFLSDAIIADHVPATFR